MNVDSDTFPSTGEDWAQDDLFANTTFATFQQAEPLDPIVQPNDGFSGHPNDHDPGVDEEDWFNDGNWQKSSVGNTAVSQQTDELDVFDKHNNGSLPDNLNDSSAQGVDNDVVSSSSLFIDLIQNDSSDPDNSKKEQSYANNWFQDSLWAIGTSSSTTNVVASKDDDDKFTSSL
ncbi:hypothetical protein Tco_0717438 [Tanacetum coccineum]